MLIYFLFLSYQDGLMFLLKVPRGNVVVILEIGDLLQEFNSRLSKPNKNNLWSVVLKLKKRKNHKCRSLRPNLNKLEYKVLVRVQCHDAIKMNELNLFGHLP